MADTRLTADFWLSEFLRSEAAVRRGLDNQPPATAMGNLCNILAPGMQRIRSLLMSPVQITSGYRSPAVNAAVGGAASSQHVEGLAADFVAPAFGPPRMICRTLAANVEALGIDQLIFEGQWVHVSFAAKPRGEVLTAHFVPGQKVSYTKGVQ